MRNGSPSYNQVVLLRFLSASCLILPLCAAVPSTGSPSRRSNPLNIDWDPAPPPDKGAPLSAGAIRDPAFLPAQIGGIVGSYALSLVLVALLLLALSKTRRQHLEAADLPEGDKADLLTFNPFPQPFLLQSEEEYKKALEQGLASPRSPYKNFSHPLSPTRSGPLSPTKSHHSGWTIPGSPTSTVLAAGADYSVDQTVVQQDKAMAQAQLEDMYKYVMEHEEAKQAGRDYQPPVVSPTARSVGGRSGPTTPVTPGFKKNKPAGLNLAREEKTQSRSSSLLSFLRSPRKSKNQGMNISSPIITPMSGTFPSQHDQEMGPMTPRSYGAVPPPVQSDLPFRRAGASSLPTPEMSPVSAGGIDERIDAALARPPTRDRKTAGTEARSEKSASQHTREVSAESGSGSNSDAEPVSAVSEKSTSGLVGLPSSPKPSVNRFPSMDSLPASPRPGSTFSRASKPTAVRTGGALPLRAYEPSLASPSVPREGTKQTVFTRAAGPLSPGLQSGMRTPWTGAPVPYTPYQPFSPVVPITPSLVTRADRKRMRKFEPKTPTVEMVRGEDEVW
ncbi:hypothetical protein QBC34DRAFT_414717 [Podospora aff. communis PSN243]|uniref:Uncharacterized protein n=1 Tax=Podospora aff. communis PSN243 TaxID=3040156 RepID=A0AAV9G7U9_9PEZI|nr:hypothetical protein QBC34DRAFT_414717 [Podospora aff. communis PSN243]